MTAEKAVTVQKLIEMHSKAEKIAAIAAFDYPTALLADRAGVEIVFVGDSLAMTVLGYTNTLQVGMEDMLLFAKAVRRACKRAFVVGDMPYMSYKASVEEAVRNAGRFMAEAGCDAVKMEGGKAILPQIRATVSAGIPTMGHLGLTPQSAAAQGGFKVQARSAEAAMRLLEDALALEQAGVCGMSLELVPARISAEVTNRLSVPTISAGSGLGCSGQVIVYHDLVGLNEDFIPSHVKQYAKLAPTIEKALHTFVEEVHHEAYPQPQHCVDVPDEVFNEFCDLAATQ